MNLIKATLLKVDILLTHVFKRGNNEENEPFFNGFNRLLSLLMRTKISKYNLNIRFKL